MQAFSLTVGTTATKIATSGAVQLGMKLLARTDNAGDVFFGTTPTVDTSSGVLVSQGDPAASLQTVIPASHFTAGEIYLIASEADQVVDCQVQ